ncbi:hypothetical protein [Nocardia sp. NPDC004711]
MYWHWTNLGNPGGTNLADYMGVVAMARGGRPSEQRPMCFMGTDVGNAGFVGALPDPHLWLNEWDGRAWRWSDVGYPGSGYGFLGLDACIVGKAPDPQEPLVFAVTDSHVQLAHRDRAGWHWIDLGTQGEPNGLTVTTDFHPTFGQRALCFVQFGDSLWMQYADVNGPHWHNHGAPPGTVSMGVANATTVLDAGGAERPVCFVIASSGPDCWKGELWAIHWDGTIWQWTDLGRPPIAWFVGGFGVGVTGSSSAQRQRTLFFGVATRNTPAPDNPDHLWVNEWDGATSEWTDLGRPVGSGLHPLGAEVVTPRDMTGTPYYFIAGDDGHVWMIHRDGATWQWADHGNPGVEATFARVSGSFRNADPVECFSVGGNNLWVNWPSRLPIWWRR